jgi:hypothetical protein
MGEDAEWGPISADGGGLAVLAFAASWMTQSA